MPALVPIRWVFFDLGGTLIDFRDPTGWAELAQRAGVETDPEHLSHSLEEIELEADDAGDAEDPKVFWRRVLERAVGASVPSEAVQQFVALREAHPAVLHLFSDVVRCLDQLRADGRKMAIISNSRSTDAVQGYLRRTGIEAYFAWIVSSGTEGVSKPDPEIFRRAIERARIRPSEGFHIGDLRSTDARAAARVGLRAVWLNRRGTGFGEDPPEITSLTELPHYLREVEETPVAPAGGGRGDVAVETRAPGRSG